MSRPARPGTWSPTGWCRPPDQARLKPGENLADAGRNITTDIKPVVAVWVDYFASYSETFIANQMAALQRWTPMPIGLSVLEGGLPAVPEFAPFTLHCPPGCPDGSRRSASISLGTGRCSAPATPPRTRPFRPGACTHCRSRKQPSSLRRHLPRIRRQSTARSHVAAAACTAAGCGAVFARADRLVAVSHHVKDRLVELGGPRAQDRGPLRRGAACGSRPHRGDRRPRRHPLRGPAD